MVRDAIKKELSQMPETSRMAECVRESTVGG